MTLKFCILPWDGGRQLSRFPIFPYTSFMPSWLSSTSYLVYLGPSHSLFLLPPIAKCTSFSLPEMKCSYYSTDYSKASPFSLMDTFTFIVTSTTTLLPYFPWFWIIIFATKGHYRTRVEGNQSIPALPYPTATLRLSPCMQRYWASSYPYVIALLFSVVSSWSVY